MSRLSDNSQLWLATGERCAASETVFTYCTGVDALSDHGEGHPETLADLRRCRLLLEEFCPELRSCLPRVAHLSSTWAEFVSFWQDLCLLQDLEDPDWRLAAGKATKTLMMLRNIIARTNTETKV